MRLSPPATDTQRSLRSERGTPRFRAHVAQTHFFEKKSVPKSAHQRIYDFRGKRQTVKPGAFLSHAMLFMGTGAKAVPK